MKVSFETYKREEHKQMFGDSIEHPCINRLAAALDEAGVPYTRDLILDGEQIRIEGLCDAVCHKWSNGHEDDLLEIQGALTEEEYQWDYVKGWMTSEEAAKRFIYCYRNNTDTYKEE